MDPYGLLKEATRWMWALGDYGEVATHLEPHAQVLVVAAGVGHGMNVLDVAAGNGNFAITAAMAGASVTATDLTPKMIALGQARTTAANLKVDWREADAEALPFADKRFDIVASVFGAMFAPRPDQVASELFRVIRKGGTVAMANYSKAGFLGSFADLLTKFCASPLGGLELPSPFEWGDPEIVGRRLSGKTASLRLEGRSVTFSFRSLEEGWEFWERTKPAAAGAQVDDAAGALSGGGGAGPGPGASDERAGDGALILDSEYLQIVAGKSCPPD